MTVSSNDRRKEYPGNGVATTFNGPRAFTASDIKVYLVDNATNLVTEQSTGAYTLTGVGKLATVVTMAVAPPTGKTLLILRTVPYDQDTDITNQGKFLPEIHENAFDKRVMQVQQLADAIARALVASELSVGDNWNFDAQGRRIINLGNAVNPGDAVNLLTLVQQLGEFEASGLNMEPKYWDLAGADGVETVFFLPGADISSPVFYDVYVNGVAIEPEDGYSIQIAPDTAGSTITFVTPPANLANVWVVLRGYARPLSTDYLTTILNSTQFQTLLTQTITNTLYETTTVLELGPLRSLIPLADVAGTALTVDGTHESYLLRCTNAAATTLTVRANTGSGTLDWETNPIAAPYFSVKQHGAGQVTIAGEGGVTITPPPGYLAKTRAQGSIVTATADYIAGGQWTLSGDLAIDEAYVPGGALARFNKVLAAAHSNTTVTPTTPAGFTANVAAGKSYRVRLLGTYQTAATTTGCIVGILGAAGAGGTVAGRAKGAVSAAAVATELSAPLTALSGAGSTLTTTDVSAINTPHHVEFDAVFVCTANGTLSLVFASESAGSAAQLNAGAHFSVEEIQVTP